MKRMVYNICINYVNESRIRAEFYRFLSFNVAFHQPVA